MKLILYELYKIWSFRYLRLILAILLVINLAVAWVYSYEFVKSETELPESSYTLDELRHISERALDDPEWFGREYDRIMQEYEVYDWTGPAPKNIYSNNDLSLFLEVKYCLDAYDVFVNNVNTVISDAENVLKLNSIYPDVPELDGINDYQHDIIARYTRISDEVEPYQSHKLGWAEYFGYTTSLIFMFIWTAILSATMYSEHITSGFASILHISRSGGRKTVLAKFTAVSIATILSVIMFSLTSMLAIELRIGFSGGGAAIQMLTDPDVDYSLVPFLTSIRGYAAINVLIKCASMIAVAGLVSAVTTFTNGIFGFAAGFAVYVSQYALSETAFVTTSQWKNVNLIDICSDNTFLTRLREVSIFGKAWDLVPITLVILLVIAVLSAILSMWRLVHKRTEVKRVGVLSKIVSCTVTHTKSKLYARSRRRYPRTLFGYETAKNRTVLRCATAFLVLSILASSIYYKPPITAYDRMYGEIMQTLEGEYTPEKAQMISETYADYLKTVDMYDECLAKYFSGEMSPGEFFAYYDLYRIAQGRLPVYKSLVRQSEHLAKTPGGWYFYDTGVLEYANRDNDWGALLFVLILGAGIFLPEYRKKSSESTTISVIRTTKRGRRKFVSTKLLFVTISAVIASVVANAVEIYCYLQNYDTSAISAPMRSITEYAAMPSWLTVGGYFALTAALSVVGAVILALFACAISCIGERAVTVYAVVTVLLLPYASVLLGMDFMAYADLTRLSDAQRLLALTKDGGLLPTAIYYAVTTVGAVLAVRAVYAKTERKA